jgi:hypothetical protein
MEASRFPLLLGEGGVSEAVWVSPLASMQVLADPQIGAHLRPVYRLDDVGGQRSGLSGSQLHYALAIVQAQDDMVVTRVYVGEGDCNGFLMFSMHCIDLQSYMVGARIRAVAMPKSP